MEDLSTDKQYDYRYFNLFPSINFSWKFQEKSKLVFFASKKINRPSYGDLAPYFVLLTPTIYETGNLNLRPSIGQEYRITYFKSPISTSLQYSRTENAILRSQPSLSANENLQLFYPINIPSISLTSLSIDIPFNIFKWWTTNQNFVGIYQLIKPMQQFSNKDIYFNLKTIHNFSLQKKIKFQTTFNFQTKRNNGWVKRRSGVLADAVLQKNFTSSNLVLDIGVYNLFDNTFLETSYSNSQKISIYKFNSFEKRIVRISVTKTIGISRNKNPRGFNKETLDRL